MSSKKTFIVILGNNDRWFLSLHLNKFTFNLEKQKCDLRLLNQVVFYIFISFQ